MASQPQRTRIPMPRIHPLVRRRTFAEVACGYDARQAVAEANRCRMCAEPSCSRECPLGVDVRGFVGSVVGGQFEAAYRTLVSENPLSGICSRVCPQDGYCERDCGRSAGFEAVGIGRLERFVTDWAALHHVDLPIPTTPSTGRTVAVVGGGPAGLMAAADLARLGHAVTIFEAGDVAGGTLAREIPDFRLPKPILRREIDRLQQMGIEIRVNQEIGRSFTLDELFADLEYAAVFLATGTPIWHFPSLSGIDLNGVNSVREYLARPRSAPVAEESGHARMVNAQQVVVIGGDDGAIDAARSALRFGLDRVCLVFRGTRSDMRARGEDVDYALEEGVRMVFLAAPVEILGNQRHEVAAVRFQEMRIADGADGQRATVPIDGADFTLDATTVVFGRDECVIGGPAGTVGPQPGARTADLDTGATHVKGLFAGGHLVTGSGTVVSAMAAGRRAARAIHRYLESPLPDGC